MKKNRKSVVRKRFTVSERCDYEPVSYASGLKLLACEVGTRILVQLGLSAANWAISALKEKITKNLRNDDLRKDRWCDNPWID